MTRTGAILLLTFGLVLALIALWMGGGLIPGPSGSPGVGSAQALTSAGELNARLRALDVVPLDGAAAATFTLPTLAGQRVSLADFGGRPVLLYFWATW